MENSNMPAYANERMGDNGKGLTKREEFAKCFVQSLLVGVADEAKSGSFHSLDMDNRSNYALMQADSLLKALEADNGNTN